MSDRDAEIVRRQWEEIARRSPLSAGDLSRFVEDNWDPEIRYEEDPRWPGSAGYSGREQVKAVFDNYWEVMGSPRLALEEVIDAGDQQVVLVRIAGTSTESGLPWEHVWAYLCRLNDGRLVYLRAYWDPDEARAAAGVSSS